MVKCYVISVKEGLRNMRKIIGFLTLFINILMMCFTSVSANALNIATMPSGNISVYIDEKKVNFDVYPQIINGRTMVPIRDIFEEFGAEIKWNEKTKTVTVKKDMTNYSMTIGNNIIFVGNLYMIMDVSPIIINNRTFVPVRFVSEALGYEVLWDSNKKIVMIDTKKESEIELYKIYMNKNFAMMVPSDWNIDESYIAEDVIFMHNEDFSVQGNKEIVSVSGIEYSRNDFFSLVRKWTNHLTYQRKAKIISAEQVEINGSIIYKITYLDEGDYITSCFIKGGKKAYNISFISDNSQKFNNKIDKILSTFNIL